MKGKITQWNDEKGFGFITPDDNSEKIFFHISVLNPKSQRPKINDVVLFEKQLTVPIYDNRRSIISGNLFSTIGNKDLTITVNDLWGEDNNINL